MNVLNFLLKALLFLVVAFFVGGYTIPDSWTIARDLTIKASPEVIYPYVSHFKQWTIWSPWNPSKDPTLQYTYTGPETGVGARQAWTSAKMGSGWMQCTAANQQTGISYDLFIKMRFIQSTIHGNISFVPSINNNTKVTWTDKGQSNGSYAKRWTNFLFKPMLGNDIEAALAGLKKIAEGSQEASSPSATQ